jgi:hypothetical protein
MKYQVLVYENSEFEPVITPFGKIQEAHSFMVNRSRQLKGEFYYILVTTHNSDELERLTGSRAR